MVGLRALDRKVLRDLARLWSQSLAIALVMACGVMTLVLALGAYRSLQGTKEAYYQRYRFAHVFATATRAPMSLKPRIEAIEGVSAASLRIRSGAILDIPGMAEPAMGLVLSLPANGQPEVNRLFLRDGLLPAADVPDEVALDERFAKAHGFVPGDRFTAIINGKRLSLRISAIVLSPEFIYAPDPGGLVPDDRRFAVFYMPRRAMEALLDMRGGFNDAALLLLRGAAEDQVIANLDRVLKPYGGRGAYGRDQQTSHAFLMSELTGLKAMAQVIPPIFLLVSAFLVNMILSRLISLEREQIGLLKANGYSSLAVAGHYSKLVSAIAVVGVVTGSIAGGLLGRGLTQLYAEFYKFPFLIYRESPDLYVIATVISVVAALLGAARAIWSAARLPPAVAMRPPAPARFRQIFARGRAGSHLLPQLTVMAFRHVLQHPLRSLLTTVAAGFAVALMVAALFTSDSMNFMIEDVFFRAERADARIDFSHEMAPSVMAEVRRLPGVLSAEPSRQADVVLRNGHHSQRIGLVGRPSQPQLSRVLDMHGTPIAMPPDGILLTERLARQLHVVQGDRLDVDLVDEGGRRVRTRVAGIVRAYIGKGAYADLAYLDRLREGGPRIGAAWLKVDPEQLQALYAAVKSTPGLGSVTLQTLSRDQFRALMDENIGIMMSVYVTIAVIVAFGVVYNSARIQLSERGRELASLRVLGFGRGQVFMVLAVEMAAIVLLAQPLGWAMGYGIALAVVAGFDSDLYRLPMVIYPATYAWATIVVLTAAAASAAIVRWRVARLDLIRVLKTRE